MKEKIKNVGINSEILNPIIEKKNNKLEDIKNLKTDVLRQNSLLNYLSYFEKNPLFKTKILKKWELLFNEWSVDNNLYIVKSWILSVEKYTTTSKEITKQLAILKTWDFLWEASLDKKNSKKEVLIKALENSEILSIDAKEDLKKFIEELPNIWYELLKHIIIQTNKRLLEANKLISSNYEIEREINKLKMINEKNFFGIIDKTKWILDIDYVLYFEKHQVLENYLILKYDSRQPNKLQDKIFERSGYFLDLDELFEKCNIKKEDKLMINKLSIWNEVFWYLVFSRGKYWFNSSDRKVFSSISNSLAWVIKKLWTDKELRNKIYISEMKKINNNL